MSNALAKNGTGGEVAKVAPPNRGLQLNTFSTAEWPMIREQASMLVKTGFLPKEIDTPEKAIAVMMKGRELGIGAMYALSNIAVIMGKPTANSELMLALIGRDNGPDAMQIAESTHERCTIDYRVSPGSPMRSYSFTIEQAKRAELTTGRNAHSWRKFPEAMLRARCISAVARFAFPATIAGMYTPEELGAVVGEDGEVIDADPAEQPPRHAQAQAKEAPARASVGAGAPEGPGSEAVGLTEQAGNAQAQESAEAERKEKVAKHIRGLRVTLDLDADGFAAILKDLGFEGKPQTADDYERVARRLESYVGADPDPGLDSEGRTEEEPDEDGVIAEAGPTTRDQLLISIAKLEEAQKARNPDFLPTGCRLAKGMPKDFAKATDAQLATYREALVDLLKPPAVDMRANYDAAYAAAVERDGPAKTLLPPTEGIDPRAAQQAMAVTASRG